MTKEIPMTNPECPQPEIILSFGLRYSLGIMVWSLVIQQGMPFRGRTHQPPGLGQINHHPTSRRIANTTFVLHTASSDEQTVLHYNRH
jgi:hypothetical protein